MITAVPAASEFNSNRRLAFVKIVAAALAALCILGATAFVALEPARSAPEARVPVRPNIDRTPTFAVAGDSITAWLNMSFPNPVSDAAEFDPITWTHYAIQDGLELTGGYARGGSRIEDIADHMIPVNADVLVVLVSTNDVVLIDPAELEGQVERIVDTAGVDTVLVCAIPPFIATIPAAAHNVELERIADSHGWAFVDPWAAVRAPDGEWLDGFTVDHVHPNAAAAAIAADVIVPKIRELHALAQMQ